jgi:hypothetical protein
MRTLLEILESAKDGCRPSHEECYWAMLALDGLLHFDAHALHRLAHEPGSLFNTPTVQSTESFHRHKRAFATNPKQYVGWENSPSNPAYLARRRAFQQLAKRVLGEEAV